MQNNGQETGNRLYQEELQNTGFAGEEELLGLGNAVLSLPVNHLSRVAHIEWPHTGVNPLLAKAPQDDLFIHIVLAAFPDVAQQQGQEAVYDIALVAVSKRVEVQRACGVGYACERGNRVYGYKEQKSDDASLLGRHRHILEVAADKVGGKDCGCEGA